MGRKGGGGGMRGDEGRGERMDMRNMRESGQNNELKAQDDGVQGAENGNRRSCGSRQLSPLEDQWLHQLREPV